MEHQIFFVYKLGLINFLCLTIQLCRRCFKRVLVLLACTETRNLLPISAVNLCLPIASQRSHHYLHDLKGGPLLQDKVSHHLSYYAQPTQVDLKRQAKNYKWWINKKNSGKLMNVEHGRENLARINRLNCKALLTRYLYQAGLENPRLKWLILDWVKKTVIVRPNAHF